MPFDNGFALRFPSKNVTVNGYHFITGNRHATQPCALNGYDKVLKRLNPPTTVRDEDSARPSPAPLRHSASSSLQVPPRETGAPHRFVAPAPIASTTEVPAHTLASGYVGALQQASETRAPASKRTTSWRPARLLRIEQNKNIFLTSGTVYGKKDQSGTVCLLHVSSIVEAQSPEVLHEAFRCFRSRRGPARGRRGPARASARANVRRAHATEPPAITLGVGLPTALANPANVSGGVPLLGGAVAPGDCLVWGANGIQDAGSACATSNVTGMGAPVATSLSNRATDFGVTFNLKTDFGAKCDGVTDDTAAIQNWLNKAASGVRLVSPAGTCIFSSALTIPAANSLTLQGAGAGVTIFQYTGANTTNDLLTFGVSTGGGHGRDRFADFSIVSSTVMTSGFAFHTHGIFDTVIQNVWTDDVNGGSATAGNLCGGFWIDGAGGVDMLAPTAYSAQSCGDGIRVNEAQGGSAELRIVGGDIGGKNVSGMIYGFANALHMAGGFGGLRCDQTNFHNSGNGLLIDTAVTAIANREFNEGPTCAFDTMANNGVLVNDTLASGGTVSIAGWVGSTLAGHGVNIQAWAAGDVEISGDKVYNNCGSGVYVADTTAYVALSSGTVIQGNGTTHSSNAGCVAWQTANAGHGYGVEAAAPTNKISGAPLYAANTVTGVSGSANFNTSTGLSAETVNSTPGQQARLNVNQVGGGNSAVLAFQENGTDEYTYGYNPTGNIYGINDKTTGTPIPWLSLSPGGNATLGEATTSVLTVKGVALLTSYTVSSLGAAVPCSATTAGAIAYVTDATSPSWNATLTGGGSVHTLAMCNGANWTAH